MAIKWSKDERAAVAAELVNVYVANPFLKGYDAIMRAQRVLPKERQRSSMSKTMPTLYTAEIVEAKTQAAQIRKASKAVPPQPALPLPVLDPTLGDMFERLVDRMARQIVAEWRKEMNAAAPLTQLRTNTKEREQLLNTSKRKREIDILIIGLNGQQLSELEDLEERLGLDLKFLDVEEAITRNYVHRNYTILMTKFISHSVQDKYRNANNLQYCNGGITNLRTMLTEIAERHK